jgi:hypothetical protein
LTLGTIDPGTAVGHVACPLTLLIAGIAIARITYSRRLRK